MEVGLGCLKINMKSKTKNILIILFLFFYLVENVQADKRENELDFLFDELKNANFSKGKQIENEIWKIWVTHQSENRRGYRLTELLSRGDFYISQKEFNDAYDIFSLIISTDPSWAEAWNKRATVLYLIGEYENSQKDIDMVLKLEGRHFGALSGQGLVQIELKNYKKALESYEKALKIYPLMEAPQTMIPLIKKLIKDQSI